MRAGAPDEVLTGVCGWRPVVSSWLGGTWLADVPVSRGRATAKLNGADLSEQLTLTVPRWDGRDWLPGDDPRHPLARYGQELQASIIVTSAVTGQEWETRIGRFLVTDWDESDAGISVTAEGLLRRVADDKLIAPLQPTGTLVSEARRLLPLGMSAAFDPALVDRTCPAGMAWSQDRLEALKEIAAAWPARLRTDEWGQVRFLAPLPDEPTPILRLVDGERGTLIAAPRSDTRAGAYNRVIARSSAADREDVQAIADQTTGPMSVTGDYGVVTREWSSPLLENRSTANTAAISMLRSSLLPTQTIPARCAPDPRVQIEDPVEVVRNGEPPIWGWVTGVDIPLTVADGEQRVDVGVAA